MTVADNNGIWEVRKAARGYDGETGMKARSGQMMVRLVKREQQRVRLKMGCAKGGR
jgi:hypothetical protein